MPRCSALLLLGAHLSSLAPPIPIEVRPAHRAVQRTGARRAARRSEVRSDAAEAGDAEGRGRQRRQAEAAASRRRRRRRRIYRRSRPTTRTSSSFCAWTSCAARRIAPAPRRCSRRCPTGRRSSTGSSVSPHRRLRGAAHRHRQSARRDGDLPRGALRRRAEGARARRPHAARRRSARLQHRAAGADDPDAAERALAPRDMGDPRTTWLRSSTQFDRVAQADNGPAVLVTLSDAPALIHFGDGLPTPQAIALAATADASPAVRVRVVFADAAAGADLRARVAGHPAALSRGDGAARPVARARRLHARH